MVSSSSVLLIWLAIRVVAVLSRNYLPSDLNIDMPLDNHLEVSWDHAARLLPRVHSKKGIMSQRRLAPATSVVGPLRKAQGGGSQERGAEIAPTDKSNEAGPSRRSKSPDPHRDPSRDSSRDSQQSVSSPTRRDHPGNQPIVLPARISPGTVSPPRVSPGRDVPTERETSPANRRREWGGEPSAFRPFQGAILNPPPAALRPSYYARPKESVASTKKKHSNIIQTSKQKDGEGS